MCQNAYHYGENPIGNPPPNTPVQCSETGPGPTNCYTLGHDAGYSTAEKEIIRCHLIAIRPAADHTPQFEIGWKAGWLQANKESHNPNSVYTYGANCTKYY